MNRPKNEAFSLSDLHLESLSEGALLEINGGFQDSGYGGGSPSVGEQAADEVIAFDDWARNHGF